MRFSRRDEFAVPSFKFFASASAGNGTLSDARRRLCSGRLPRRVVLLSFMAATLATAQAVHQQAAKNATAHRANELTLAGLRPGRDTLNRAMQLYHTVDPKSSTNDSQTVWLDTCARHTLTVDFDDDKKIQVIRTGLNPTPANCRAVSMNVWKTGHGLGVGDTTARLSQLYGEADSKSPSTRDGQPLELWYYAFDWAGPDVPQVMEVLCTRESEGQPGRVVEITLAAPSL
jgi:hypothetical protein